MSDIYETSSGRSKLISRFIWSLTIVYLFDFITLYSRFLGYIFFYFFQWPVIFEYYLYVKTHDCSLCNGLWVWSQFCSLWTMCCVWLSSSELYFYFININGLTIRVNYVINSQLLTWLCSLPLQFYIFAIFIFSFSFAAQSPVHLTHFEGLLQKIFVCPYVWGFIHCAISLLTRGDTFCMMEFTIVWILYISLLFPLLVLCKKPHE